MEGVRPILIEIQALVSTTCFGMPRRMANGFDYNRLILLMAVLEKRVGLMLTNQDAYVNAVGGIKLQNLVADLAVILAVASSFRNISLDAETVVMEKLVSPVKFCMVSRVDLRIRVKPQRVSKRFVVPAGNLARA